jgi:hypothetical protein
LSGCAQYVFVTVITVVLPWEFVAANEVMIEVVMFSYR